VVSGLHNSLDSDLEQAVKDFITQESSHCYQHTHYNSILEKQGFKNVLQGFIDKLQKHSHRRLSPVTKLAIVCAYEHYTAILGNFVLNNSQILESAERDMVLFWGWHSAEETEYKAVCFDLYLAEMLDG